MMFEEARRAAAELLQEREQLLNGHLMRLVNKDKDLFRDVRQSLIKEGIAEDRAGVGLVRLSPENNLRKSSDNRVGSDVKLDRTIDHATAEADDYWIMVSGRTRGPFDYETLQKMVEQQELNVGDVIRRGRAGRWVQPSSLIRPGQDIRRHDSTAVDPSTTPAARRLPDSATLSSEPSEYLPPGKIWSLESRSRPSWLMTKWKIIADLFGGPKRLTQILIAIFLVSVLVVWWKLPPAPGTVYQEFADCYSQLQKLRERRIGRSEWTPTVNRFRPLVKRRVSQLRYSRKQVEHELYKAGTLGLLPLLEVPSDPTQAERLFDKHMAAARRFIDKPQGSSNGN
jgi:hypothetical protein